MLSCTQGDHMEPNERAREFALFAGYLAILDGIVLTYLFGAVVWSADWESTLVEAPYAAVAFSGNLVLWPIYLISKSRPIGSYVLAAKALATALFMPLSVGVISLLSLLVMTGRG